VNVGTKSERRFVELAELRLDGESETKSIRGYAAVFDAMSQPLFGFREIIRKGAFKKTIKDGDIRALWNHDPNYVLGRKSARTLRLEEDDKGLLSRIFPPDTQWARDLMTSIERGDVSQMSFGFRTVKDNWLPPGDDGLPIRELLSCQLFDVSPVTYPAYPQTEVHVRALMDAVLWKMGQGPIDKEEREAIALALANVRTSVLEQEKEIEEQEEKQEETQEPGQPHSEELQSREPGQPHSEERQQRTILERRKRLLDLVKL
jgi:HK97 family phage prohead protease